MIKVSSIFSFAPVVALLVGLFAPQTASAVSDKFRQVSEHLTADAEQVLLQGKAAEADKLLNLALTANPGNARAFVLKGQAQGKLDNKAESLRLITVGLDIEPGNQQALKLQGEAALGVGDIEQAEKSLNRLRTVCAAPCEAANDLMAAIDAKRDAKDDKKD